MRREWIEITSPIGVRLPNDGLPPCGGSGLKFLDSKTHNGRMSGLPPCGGSGLKCLEIGHGGLQRLVSLHAEGVD